MEMFTRDVVLVIIAFIALLSFIWLFISINDFKDISAITLLVLCAIIYSSIATENKLREEQPKKMTINYEFRDSVYVPIDTVINNN